MCIKSDIGEIFQNEIKCAAFASLLYDIFEQKNISTGPIIRREEIYKNMTMEERKRIFHALFNFARRLEFKYICTFVDKNQCNDVIKMTSKLSRNIASTISDNSEFFNSFDRIIIYYDNGQVELTKIITSVFKGQSLILCKPQYGSKMII